MSKISAYLRLFDRAGGPAEDVLLFLAEGVGHGNDRSYDCLFKKLPSGYAFDWINGHPRIGPKVAEILATGRTDRFRRVQVDEHQAREAVRAGENCRMEIQQDLGLPQARVSVHTFTKRGAENYRPLESFPPMPDSYAALVRPLFEEAKVYIAEHPTTNIK